MHEILFTNYWTKKKQTENARNLFVCTFMFRCFSFQIPQKTDTISKSVASFYSDRIFCRKTLKTGVVFLSLGVSFFYIILLAINSIDMCID